DGCACIYINARDVIEHVINKLFGVLRGRIVDTTKFIKGYVCSGGKTQDTQKQDQRVFKIHHFLLVKTLTFNISKLPAIAGKIKLMNQTVTDVRPIPRLLAVNRPMSFKLIS